MAIYMEMEDIDKVLEAMNTLYIINQKYGQLHGENPVGIVFTAYENLKRRLNENTDKQ